MMQIASEPIKFSKAHDQGPPFRRVDPILVIFTQDVLGSVHANNSHLNCFHGRANSRVADTEIMNCGEFCF